jgi:hypothetical protein
MATSLSGMVTTQQISTTSAGSRYTEKTFPEWAGARMEIPTITALKGCF